MGDNKVWTKVRCLDWARIDPMQPARISRSIPGNGPVENLGLNDLQCNTGAAPAKLHATAAAGSTVTLHWTLWPDSHMGPVLTYMARCPDTGCQDYQPGSSWVGLCVSRTFADQNGGRAVWFKVKEAGRSGTSNTWATVSSHHTQDRGSYLPHIDLPDDLPSDVHVHDSFLPEKRLLPCPP